MSRVVVEMSAEDAKLHAAIARAVSDHAKLGAGIDKVGETSRKAAREEEALGRAAKKVYEDTRDPMEKHAARMQRISQLCNQGKIDANTYERAASASYAKMSGELDKLRGTAVKAGSEMGTAGEKAASAFGPQAIGWLKNFATGVLGIGSATSLVIGLLREMSRIKEEAAQTSRDAAVSMGSLKQLTSDQGKYNELVAAAKEIAAKGGATSLDEGAKVAFALESAGLLDQRQTFIDLRAASIISDPVALARGTKTMIASMGAAETGDARQVIGKGIAAGRFSPTHMEEILPAAARAGTAARGAKVTDEELLAATALLSEATGDPGRATTQNKAMFKALALADAYGRRDAPPLYSDEEFQRDKEALDRERDAASQEQRHAIERDPELRKQLHAIDVERAKAGRGGQGRAANPEMIARRNARMRELADEERRAREEAQRRAAASPEALAISAGFKRREDVMLARKRAASAGIVTDDEGQIVDDDRLKLLREAGQAMAKAGPDLQSRLKALAGMGLDEVQLRKLFGSQEGYEGMQLLLGTGDRYGQALGAVRKAGQEDEISKLLALDAPQPQRAAEQARKQGAKYDAAAEPLGTLNNLFSAVVKHTQALRAEGGAGAFEIGIDRVGQAIASTIPGYKKSALRHAIQTDQIRDPSLVRDVNAVLGGTPEDLDRAAAERLQRPTHARTPEELTQERDNLRDVAKILKEAAELQRKAAEDQRKAAEALNASRQPRPTLGRPDQRN